MSDSRSGSIISFHAYKGGLGVTTTLANVAWVLASAGHRVLAIDWDLSSPSLHGPFRPFLEDPSLTSTEGILDAAIEFATEGVTDPTRRAEPPDLLAYAVSLDWQFPNGGSVDLVPAGRQGPAYAVRATEFNWHRFMNDLGGAAFVGALAETARREYDYVLVDCAPGLGDTTAICTRTLPDVLCLFFAYNTASVQGARALAEAASERSPRPVRVFPVPLRADYSEKELLDRHRKMARAAMDPFLSHLRREDPPAYWGRVEFAYVPYHAYGEALAAFTDEPSSPYSLLAATERLAGYLTGGELGSIAYPNREQGAAILARYREGPAI